PWPEPAVIGSRSGIIAGVGLCLAINVAPSQSTPKPAVQAAKLAADDSVSIRIVNTELRSAMQLMGPYLDRPVIVSGAQGPTITLETPHPIPRRDVPRLLRSLLDSQNYELVDDSAGNTFRVRPREVQRPSPVVQQS